MNLDIQQLRMFFFLAQTGSFTEAARRVYRTQSAMSHAIRKLEQSVGVDLVERRGVPVRLTDAGRRLFAACELAFTSLDSAMEEIASHHGHSMGRLRIGATVEFGCSILMRHIPVFLEAYPNIEAEFHMSNRLLQKLMRDELDIIIDCKEHIRSELDRIPLFRETYAIVCSREYSRRYRIESLKDLDRVTILSVDREATWWHRVMFSLQPEVRPEFRRVLPINHIRGMIVAAKSGLGVALVPAYSVLTDLTEGVLVNLFPKLTLNEDRFCIYQKQTRRHLMRHRLLIEYLQRIQPWEFGAAQI